MTSNLVELHPSLSHPVFNAMNFLNEIMREYPDAISFGPGAPNLAFLDNVAIPECLETFSAYLVERTGCTAQDAQHLLYEYGPSKGLLNELIAEALRIDDSIDVTPTSIVVTVGAQEAMILVLRALILSSTDRLAVVTPSYVGLFGAARVLGVDLVPINETADGPDLSELASAVAQARKEGAKIRALYVAPDFANPSGVVMSITARNQLLALASKEGLLLIEDTAYAFTGGFPDAIPSLKALDRERLVIQIGTFSKICSPALRVGFVIADQITGISSDRYEVLADALGRLKSMTTVNTSPICQAIAGGMLLRHGGSIRGLGSAKAKFYRDNLTALVDALDRKLSPLALEHPAITWTRPQGGFFARVKLPLEVNMDLLRRSANEFGVIWTPMSSFHVGGGGGREIRLSCSYLTPVQIETGIERLARFLTSVCTSAAQNGRLIERS